MNALKNLALVAFCLMAAGGFGAPIYLKADATGTGDGSSWTNAYTTVADAVAALNASGDARPTLKIARGLYAISAAQDITAADAVIEGKQGEQTTEAAAPAEADAE